MLAIKSDISNVERDHFGSPFLNYLHFDSFRRSSKQCKEEIINIGVEHATVQLRLELHLQF